MTIMSPGSMPVGVPAVPTFSLVPDDTWRVLLGWQGRRGHLVSVACTRVDTQRLVRRCRGHAGSPQRLHADVGLPMHEELGAAVELLVLGGVHDLHAAALDAEVRAGDGVAAWGRGRTNS